MITKLSPAHRLSFALTMLTISMLILSDFFGLLPNREQSELNIRKQVSEAIAIQLSHLASNRNYKAIENNLEYITLRNPSILSAGLRDKKGHLIASYGEHEKKWAADSDGKSSASFVQVPIYQNDGKWGTVELRYKDVYDGSLFEIIKGSVFGLVALIAILGFLSYYLFLRRALRELDPSSVIPERVRSAFDVMAEGVVIFDEKGHVVLANTAFAERLNQDPGNLLGTNISDLNWKFRNASDTTLPWDESRLKNIRRTGVPLIFSDKKKDGKQYIFTVNSSPIIDSKGKMKGVLTTFDDMTILEKKNNELSLTLDQLNKTQGEITRQNEELQFLAMHDPMTGCFNRRAFFQQFEVAFQQARNKGSMLTCLMVDIDHFKSINDNHGHAIGDQVIKLIADVLKNHMREGDFVGRYGGEEFGAVMPDTDLDEAEIFAENLRKLIKESVGNTDLPQMRLTASIGVSQLMDDIATPDQLIDLADQALYQAKNSGRNRVVRADRLEAVEPVVEVNVDRHAHDSDSNAVLLKRIKELEVLAEETREENEHSTFYDLATGLPNRTLLKDRITQALLLQKRHSSAIAVISIFVHSVNNINNAYGQDVADIYFRDIANRLYENLRESDTVAASDESNENENNTYRIDASELCIVLQDLDTHTAVAPILSRLQAALEQPVDVEGQAHITQCDFGIAMHPQDGEDADTLMRNASLAHQQIDPYAPAQHFHFYSAQMNTLVRDKIRLENELYSALENNEFELFYQPKVSMQTGAITGFEALIRWYHPTRGLVPPIEFIPLAEQSNLIIRIGNWVIQSACAQLQAWQHTIFDGLPVSINISAKQFLESNFDGYLMETIKRFAISPAYLEIELTETLLVNNPEMTAKTISRMNEYGIRVYLDDFGIGYSSLGYLKRLPINGVKIDRSFITDILDSNEDRAIVSSIVNIAHQLNLTVVAEGIETRAQMDAMYSLGAANEIQGYLLAKPMPAKELLAFMESHDAMTYCYDAEEESKHIIA